MNPWKMEVRGSTFEPSMKTLIPPYSIAYKKRVYSPARIRYPMKRVDWDPNGERNPQNRGKSKYVRISWDEALDTITSEMNRIKEKYGPTALLYQCDQHGENKVVQACHGAGRKLLPLWGGYTLQIRQPDSWEGWWWGSKHFWGCEPVGQGKQSNLLYDVAKNCELLLFWGCDQETTPVGLAGPAPQPPQLLVHRTGHQADLRVPRPQLRRGRPRRSVDPGATQHRRRPLLGHLLSVVQRRHLRQGVPQASHAVGVEAFEAYVMGEEDGEAKTPEWASPICGVPGGSSKLWPRSGLPSAPAWSSATAVPASAARTPPSPPVCRTSAWPCRVWASRA